MMADSQGPAPIIPVSHSLPDPAALATFVADQYAIGLPASCSLLRSYVNDVYDLSTASGRYAVKVYRLGWRTVPEIAWEIDLLHHLDAEGVPVARPIAARSGEFITAVRAPEGKRPVVLSEFAPGTKVGRVDATVFYHYGRASGSLHRAGAGFTSRHPRTPLDLDYLIDRPMQALQQIERRRPDDWDFLRQVATKVRSKIATLAGAGLQWGACHGDLSLDNLNITGEYGMTFYDFDTGGPGWLASDLFGPFAGAMQRDGARWDAFLRGYLEEHSLTEADLTSIPYFAAANAIWSLGGRFTHWSRWSGTWRVDDDFLDPVLADLRAWDRAYLL